MDTSYFFYDVETSGLDSYSAEHIHTPQRIIQFAGQRTNTTLEPIGEAVNIRVALPADVVPEAGALRIHGCGIDDMQKGISEPELAALLEKTVFTPGTLMVGYNNLKFDNRFIRTALWRSFHHPYEWAFKQERGSWDVMKMAMMFRALSPGGIEWPQEDGRPTNSLQALVDANGITHDHAHDALADAQVTLEFAKLLRGANPSLFDHFVAHRHRKRVEGVLGEVGDARSAPALVTTNQGFGPLATALVMPIAELDQGKVLIANLMAPFESLIDLDDQKLAAQIIPDYDDRIERPVAFVQALKLNSNPGVISSSTLRGDEATVDRLGIDRETVKANRALLVSRPDLIARIKALFAPQEFDEFDDVDRQLYQAFPSDQDVPAMERVRSIPFDELHALQPDFTDPRSPELWLRYRARYAPDALTPEEQERWEQRLQQIFAVSAEYWEEWQSEYEQGAAMQREQLDALRAWIEARQ